MTKDTPSPGPKEREKADNNHQMGMKEREKFGLDKYESGQWIKFTSGTGMYYGCIDSIDLEGREAIFSKMTQYVADERGHVLDFVDDVVFPLDSVGSHRKATEEEAKTSIENQSMYFQYLGEYVAIQDGTTIRLGKLHRILRDSIQLLPFLNTRCDKAYIEDKMPRSIGFAEAKQVIPSSKKELEHSVTELARQLGKEDKPRIILP